MHACRSTLEDPTYSLGYVGALGTVAALAVAMTGAGGLIASIIFWGGMVSSLALLAHLPKYLWEGLGQTFEGVFSSVAQSFRAFGAWHRKTDFVRNYMRGMGRIIKKYSVFVSPILLPFFVPVVAAYLLTWAAALTVGLGLGVLHAPGLYLWSAAYHKNPKSRTTRFLAGLNTVFYEQLEGTRKTFLEPFIEKYNARDGERLNWGGLFMAGLGTLLWIVRTALALVLSPALLIWGIIKGIQRASGPASENGWDNSPERVFSR